MQKWLIMPDPQTQACLIDWLLYSILVTLSVNTGSALQRVMHTVSVEKINN